MEPSNLKNLFAQHNIFPAPEQIDRFDQFLRIFIEKNSQINLSAIRKEDDIVLKHFIDSLQVLNMKEYQEAKTVVDIGTGGGFPGLPLAIMSPEKEFTLIDSIGKKVRAVEEFVAALGLKNVRTVVGRAEEMGKTKEFREKFDVCVSRAVAYLPTLLGYCLPFVKRKGYCLLYKQYNPTEQQDASPIIKKENLEFLAPFLYHIADNVEERAIFMISKK